MKKKYSWRKDENEHMQRQIMKYIIFTEGVELKVSRSEGPVNKERSTKLHKKKLLV